MQNVGAAWLMTAIAPSPIFVALVQAASNLPLFLLALPAGALADVIDRRRLLLWSMLWLCASAGLLGALTMSGHATPGALLSLTFAIGVGSAFAAPAFQAIIAELVPREELPAAVSLNGISMNLGRAAGPALGGLVVAAAGAGATFVLNAASFVAVLVAIALWRRAAARGTPSARGSLRRDARGRALRAPLARAADGALALRRLRAAGERRVGAAAAARARDARARRDRLRRAARLLRSRRRARGRGASLRAGATRRRRSRDERRLRLRDRDGRALRDTRRADRGVLLAGNGVALFAAGGAWISLLATLNAAAQAVIPPWVRARALATYLLVLFGGLAAGSALFGALAEVVGVSASFAIAGAAIAAGRVAIWRRRLPAGDGPDLSPAPRMPDPESVIPIDGDRGPVLVTVEYGIDPPDAAAFARAMRELGQIRLRDGALRWGLWADTTKPGRYLESFVVESWLEHLRQHERMTAADRAVQRVAHVFHRGGEPPRVTHFVHETIPPEA